MNKLLSCHYNIPTIEYNIFLQIRSDPAGLNILAFSRYITD